MMPEEDSGRAPSGRLDTAQVPLAQSNTDLLSFAVLGHYDQSCHLQMVESADLEEGIDLMLWGHSSTAQVACDQADIDQSSADRGQYHHSYRL